MSIMSNIRARIRAALTPKHGRDLKDDGVQFTPEQLRLSPVPPALAQCAAYWRARSALQAKLPAAAPPPRKVDDPLEWWHLR